MTQKNKQQKSEKKNIRHIVYFSLLGVEIAFTWFFWNTMAQCRASLISCAPVKAYLALLGLSLLVVELGTLIFYERKQKTRIPFGAEPNQRKWVYLLIVILLILAPIISILFF
ncbi:MAG: hypothetical protein ACP5N3_03140 [Candidatus Nanoarchaeia archaeon]